MGECHKTMWSKRSQMNTLWFHLWKSKSRQDQQPVSEIKAVIICRGHKMKGAPGAFGVLGMFHFMYWTDDRGVFSLWKLIKSYTCDLCTSLYVRSISVKTFPKVASGLVIRSFKQLLWLIWYLYNVLRFSGKKKTIIVCKRKLPSISSHYCRCFISYVGLRWTFESQCVIMV